MTLTQADAPLKKDADTPQVPEPSAADTPQPGERREDWHWLQRLLDNPWILLLLGILVPFLSYTTWGWIELLLIKPAQLP